MEKKKKEQYEAPSAEVLFVTVERNIMSVQMRVTTLSDSVYEEEDA